LKSNRLIHMEHYGTRLQVPLIEGMIGLAVAIAAIVSESLAFQHSKTLKKAVSQSI
jgi:hypothetical protein